MTAVVQVTSIIPLGNGRETVMFSGVPDQPFTEGSPGEDYEEALSFQIVISNPALVGTFALRQTYVCDFTPVPE